MISDSTTDVPGVVSSDLFGVIYADPPWRYGFSQSDSRAIESQYPTMTDDEICALKVPAAKDAVLYLWAVAPRLAAGLRVMEAWGFDYKTCAVWDKEKVGMGYWWRGQQLLCRVRGGGRAGCSGQGPRLMIAYFSPFRMSAIIWRLLRGIMMRMAPAFTLTNSFPAETAHAQTLLTDGYKPSDSQGAGTITSRADSDQ